MEGEKRRISFLYPILFGRKMYYFLIMWKVGRMEGEEESERRYTCAWKPVRVHFCTHWQRTYTFMHMRGLARQQPQGGNARW